MRFIKQEPDGTPKTEAIPMGKAKYEVYVGEIVHERADIDDLVRQLYDKLRIAAMSMY